MDRQKKITLTILIRIDGDIESSTRFCSRTIREVKKLFAVEQPENGKAWIVYWNIGEE